MRGTTFEASTGWGVTRMVPLSVAFALLIVLATTSANAQEVCIPEDPYCGEERPQHTPPELYVRNASATVTEGEMAYNSGVYDDTFDEDQGESVTFSASKGTVSKTGTDKGRWSWKMPTDRYGQFHPAGDREHTIKITATDSTGRSSNVTFTLTVKPVPPTVELTSPSEGAAVKDTTKLSATAEDNVGIDRVYFFANGKYVGWDPEAPYEYSWDSTTIADGPVTIMTRAYDLSNNATESAPRLITVDNTAPSAPSITTPSEGARATGAFSLRGYAEPDSAVELFEGTDSKGVVTADDSGHWSFPLTDVAEGPHVYHATATDRVGNVSTASAIRRVIVDNIRPTVTAVTPPDRARKVAATANLMVTFSEEMNASTIDETTLILTRKGSTAPIKANVYCGPARKRAILDPDRRLADGTIYIATIVDGASGVRDLAGNDIDRGKVWSFRTR